MGREENEELYGGLGRADSAYWTNRRKAAQPRSPVRQEPTTEVPRYIREQRQNARFVKEIDENGINVESVSKDIHLKATLLRILDIETREFSDVQIGRLFRSKYHTASKRDDTAPF